MSTEELAQQVAALTARVNDLERDAVRSRDQRSVADFFDNNEALVANAMFRAFAKSKMMQKRFGANATDEDRERDEKHEALWAEISGPRSTKTQRTGE